MDIKKVITVCVLSDKLSDYADKFGSRAESSFPDSPHFTIFFDENDTPVGFGKNEFALTTIEEAIKNKDLIKLAPFLTPEQTFAWFFSVDETNVSDMTIPSEITKLSVGFNWNGDATNLENSLQEEVEDDWESELENFNGLLISKDTLAIGWKYVRNCDWVINSSEDLNHYYADANWDVDGEGCFVIVKY